MIKHDWHSVYKHQYDKLGMYKLQKYVNICRQNRVQEPFLIKNMKSFPFRATIYLRNCKASSSLMRKALVWDQVCDKIYVCKSQECKEEMLVCMRRNRQREVKTPGDTGARDPTHCRIGPGLFPSTLSMISRKQNCSSDPLWRSNISLPHINPSVTCCRLFNTHLYISVAFLFQSRYQMVPDFQLLLYFSWALSATHRNNAAAVGPGLAKHTHTRDRKSDGI